MIRSYTWSMKSLEKFRMDHPYSTISEMIELMNDEAIQTAYLPIKTSMAIDASSPVGSKEERIRVQATSRAEKQFIMGKKAIAKQKPLMPPNRAADPQKTRHRENASGTVVAMIEKIRTEGPKPFGQIIGQYKEQGLVRVPIEGGSIFLTPEKAAKFMKKNPVSKKTSIIQEGPFYNPELI
jgi:hypothetical protein